MELSLTIRITAKDLYDYMLYHIYTSAQGLIGSVVGALLVVAYFMDGNIWWLLCGLIILLYLPWTLFLRANKQYLSNPAFKEPLQYHMDDEGITVSQKEEEQKQNWEDMVKAVSTPRSIILYTSRVNASIFPKKELGDNAAALIQMISTHMPPKKVKIRG